MILCIRSFSLLALLAATTEGKDQPRETRRQQQFSISSFRTLHTVEDEGGTLMTDPEAEVIPDSLSATSSFAICDDFDRPDGGLGEGWFDSVYNTLNIVSGQVDRTGSIEGWQYATYQTVSYNAEEPFARVHVQNFNPLAGEGSVGVGLSLGVGGASPLAPAVLLVSDFNNNQVYGVCTYSSGEQGLWGNFIVALEGNRNTVGSDFVLEISMDPTTGETQLGVTDIVEGPYAGQSIVFPCGVFPDYETIGAQAGVGVFASDEVFTATVDDFGHSGCSEVEEPPVEEEPPTEEEPPPEESPPDDPVEVEPECGTCSGIFVTNGVPMQRQFQRICLSFCVPMVLVETVKVLQLVCGTCQDV